MQTMQWEQNSSTADSEYTEEQAMISSSILDLFGLSVPLELLPLTLLPSTEENRLAIENYIIKYQIDNRPYPSTFAENIYSLVQKPIYQTHQERNQSKQEEVRRKEAEKERTRRRAEERTRQDRLKQGGQRKGQGRQRKQGGQRKGQGGQMKQGGQRKGQGRQRKQGGQRKGQGGSR